MVIWDYAEVSLDQLYAILDSAYDIKSVIPAVYLRFDRRQRYAIPHAAQCNLHEQRKHNIHEQKQRAEY